MGVNEIPANVIVITGTPGTGKTSVSKKLKGMGYFTISLFELAKKFDCIMGFDKDRSANIVNTEKLTDVLDMYLSAGHGTVILEGHYGEVIPSKYVNKCFVLSCPVSDLRIRLENKGYSSSKIEENMTAEIMAECWVRAIEAFGPSKVTKIDNISISETASLIETYLQVDLARLYD